MNNHSDELLEKLMGEVIALDLNSPYVAIGKLSGYDHRYLILSNVDIHDMRDSKTTREKYLVECKEYGIRANRHQAYINRHEVVSFSLMDDVITE